MSRIRTIKPEFWTDEAVVECSTNARLLFIGLWNFSDDNGVHPYSAKQIKMEVFPGDDFKISQVDGWLNELINNGLIKTYHIEDKRFLIINGWHHQKIDRPNPKYPPPRTFDDDSPNTPREFSEPSPPEGKGREGNIYSSDFLLFWQAYPKKSGSKKQAFENWKKLNGDKPAIEIILSAIQAQVEWRKNANGEFRPEWKDPERWIKGKMWEVEVDKKEAKSSW